MESSIAEFLKRKSACELLPTIPFMEKKLAVRTRTFVKNHFSTQIELIALSTIGSGVRQGDTPFLSI